MTFRCLKIQVMFLLVAAVLLSLPARPVADELDDSRRKLQQIEKRLRQTSRNLAEKKEAESRMRRDLKSVTAELQRIRRRDSDLERELERIGRKISDRRKEASDARERIESMKEQVNTRLVALYKSGDGGALKAVFSSTTPSEMARQLRYFGGVVRHDRQMLDQYRSHLDRLDLALAELERLRDSRRDLHADVRDNRQQLESAERIKRQLLARLRQDKQALAGTLAELKDRKARLEKLVKKLESAPDGKYSGGSGAFAKMKGRLSRPVKGRILVAFGTRENPELGTMHASNGIEIDAGSDRPVSAVAPGRVVFADAFKGYGNLVIVDHGLSYHSLYGNVASLQVQVGQRVAAGEVLGHSGYPGSSGLYFEIRHHGVPVDPMPWFESSATHSARRKD